MYWPYEEFLRPMCDAFFGIFHITNRTYQLSLPTQVPLPSHSISISVDELVNGKSSLQNNDNSKNDMKNNDKNDSNTKNNDDNEIEILKKHVLKSFRHCHPQAQLFFLLVTSLTHAGVSTLLARLRVYNSSEVCIFEKKMKVYLSV